MAAGRSPDHPTVTLMSMERDRWPTPAAGPAPTAVPAGPRTVGERLARDPRVAEVLERFGIHLDPFTLVALAATPEELCGYSALPDAAPLRAALDALDGGDAPDRPGPDRGGGPA